MSERLGNLEEDLGTQASNPRRVTTELNGVAIALFGVKEDTAACELRVAEPKRLSKAATTLCGSEVAALPADLILPKTLLEPAEEKQKKRSLPGNLNVRGVQRKTLFDGRQGFGIATEFLEADPDEVPHHRIGGRLG
jgi:hypothetical protein